MKYKFNSEELGRIIGAHLYAIGASPKGDHVQHNYWRVGTDTVELEVEFVPRGAAGEQKPSENS